MICCYSSSQYVTERVGNFLSVDGQTIGTHKGTPQASLGEEEGGDCDAHAMIM